MRLFGKNDEAQPTPEWRLAISPGLIEHRQETIDGINVTFDKTCWTWSVLRDDLWGRPRGGFLRDMGTAETEDEALRIGLKKMKDAQKYRDVA